MESLSIGCSLEGPNSFSYVKDKCTSLVLFDFFSTNNRLSDEFLENSGKIPLHEVSVPNAMLLTDKSCGYLAGQGNFLRKVDFSYDSKITDEGKETSPKFRNINKLI